MIMDAGHHIPGIPQNPVGSNDASIGFLIQVARMLLEFSARTEGIKRQIDRLAKHFGVEVTTQVAYRDVTLTIADGRHLHAQVPEHRLNVFVISEMLRVIDAVCAGHIGIDEAKQRLESAVHSSPQISPGMLAIIFGLGASALAWLLRADWGAIAVSGLSAGLGLLARRELGKRHVKLFVLPFAAALIGAVLGGIVYRLGWTHTPGFCLMVPALMLVPGAHLINSVNEMLENQMPMGLGRLGLSVGILIAAGLGVLLGSWITLGTPPVAATASEDMHLSLLLDVVLAGVAACAFGAFFNSPWRILGIAMVCGMTGHGIRYICLGEGFGLSVATLFACLAIGVIAQITAERLRIPFGALAFAGAVPMMPGVFFYESIAFAVKLAGPGKAEDPELAAAMLSFFVKAAFVVGAMAIGLLGGAKLADLVLNRRLPSSSVLEAWSAPRQKK